MDQMLGQETQIDMGELVAFCSAPGKPLSPEARADAFLLQLPSIVSRETLRALLIYHIALIHAEFRT